MKGIRLATAVTACLLASGFVQAAEETYTSKFNASLRLGLELNTEPEAELIFSNYGSRIGWEGTADAGKGLKALSGIEFGYDQTNGISNTRFAYLGVEGDFGRVTGGKQNKAFYDAVTSSVDIANWGSCYTEVSCGKQESIIKFVTPDTSKTQFFASAALINGDIGNDFIDGLELGAKSKSGDITWGAGISLTIGNPTTLNDKGGTGVAFGVSASKPVDDAVVSATVQIANDGYINNSNDNAIIITSAYQKDNIYGILGLQQVEETGFFITVGMKKPVIEDRAYAYFETTIVDDGIDATDTEFLARAVMVYNLDFLSVANK